MSRSKSWARGAVLSVAALVIGLSLAACGGDDDDGGGGGPKVALLLPESKTTRYEAHDHPEFEEAVNAACSDCELIYSNANQDAAQQQSQMEAALTDGEAAGRARRQL
jgi:D-xylose transport system substrate-binding protein